MATNWFARRSRGQSIGTEAENISGTRQFSAVDAASDTPIPEDDKNAVRESKDSNPSRNPNIFSRSRSRGRAEEKRPGASGRFSRSKSRSRREAGEAKGLLRRSLSGRLSNSRTEEIAKGSADLPPPQSLRLDCNEAQHDAAMIGVAVGSPSQLQPAKPASFGQSPLARMEPDVLNPSGDQSEDPTNKNKGTRWKKIGGIFKARNALTNEPAPSPLYQLHVRSAGQAVSQPDSSLHSGSVDPTTRDQDARFLFDKILGSNGQLQNPAENSHHRGRGAGGRTKDSSKLSDYTSARQPSNQGFPSGLPLLDVKIPDVQMERYSVMFGNVLDKQEPVNLLSRRDKARNKLLTISDTDEETSQAAHLQQQQPDRSGPPSSNNGHSYLMPENQSAYPRRATSPTPSKSPSFSLFPHLPQAAEKIVGPVPPGKQSPLQRSFTAPARLSPMQENFELNQVQTSNRDDLTSGNKTLTTRLEASSNIDTAQDSSRQFVTPPTLTPSVSEDVLQEIDSVELPQGTRYQSEAMTDRELKVAPLQPRHDIKGIQNEIIINEQVENEIKELRRTDKDIHEETLAALERPRSIGSKSKDASVSLKPSKARIDQIMRGASPNELPKSPAEVRNGQRSSEKPLSRDVVEVAKETQISPPPPPELAGDTHAIVTSAGSAPRMPTREENLSVKPTENGRDSTSSKASNRKELEAQNPTRTPQSTPQVSSDARITIKPQPTNPMYPIDTQSRTGFRAKQLPQSFNTGKRPPPQSSSRQAPLRPPPANTSHRLHPRANAPPPGRPPYVTADQRLPTYIPPPASYAPHSQPHLDRVHSHVRPNARLAATSSIAKDQDNILDYYLEEPEPKASTSPRKLQKRSSNTSKKRFSLSNKPLPYPKLESQFSQSSDIAPRSPLPISKYSVNAASIQNTTISPPLTSPVTQHRHSQSLSTTSTSTLASATAPTSDLRHLSPAVRAARAKAERLVEAASTSASRRSSSISNPPARPLRAEFSFIVDAPPPAPLPPPSRREPETSFYTHSNASTPSLPNDDTPSQGLGFPIGAKPPIPKRSPGRSPSGSRSRGASLSSLPGSDVESGAAPKSIPPPPVRSASEGTVGVGGVYRAEAGIQTHLRPGKGGKVIERQAGLVATIVDPERERGRGGHRAGRSVNLVIESV